MTTCFESNCIKLRIENEYFKEKLTEIYKENKKLKDVVSKFSNVTKSDSGCQTSERVNDSKETQTTQFKGSSKCSVCNQTQKEVIKPNFENSKKKPIDHKIGIDVYNQINKKSYVKLCDMHQSLLKKYEDEVNSNAVKLDLINRMKVEIDQYETKCKSYHSELNDLRLKLDNLHEIERKNKLLVIDLESYKLKCQKYHDELSLFDDEFFKDIEDLKNKYDEAVKLNKYYLQLIEKNKNNKHEKKSKVNFNINDMEQFDDTGQNVRVESLDFEKDKNFKIKQFTKDIFEKL